MVNQPRTEESKSYFVSIQLKQCKHSKTHTRAHVRAHTQKEREKGRVGGK